MQDRVPCAEAKIVQRGKTDGREARGFRADVDVAEEEESKQSPNVEHDRSQSAIGERIPVFRVRRHGRQGQEGGAPWRLWHVEPLPEVSKRDEKKELCSFLGFDTNFSSFCFFSLFSATRPRG